MIDRYTSLEIESIWSNETRWDLWLKIERLACEGWEKLKKIPKGTAMSIREVKVADLDSYKMEVLENEVKHEFLAFLTRLNELTKPEHNRFFHRGLTSSDVLDTAFAFQLREAGRVIRSAVTDVIDELKDLATEHKDTLMMGRSHGMYGEPTTFGVVMAGYYMEWERNLKRLDDAIEQINYGKISGPMGNYTIIDPKVEKYVCDALGLKVEPVSTQVIPRDRHAQFFLTLSLMGSSMERLALEIRNLQQSSVGEVSENFSKGQKGSSAMPHKRNPISSENLCGIARLLRSYAMPVLEDIPLWHQRDMSHSSVERVVAPDATHLAVYSLKRLKGVLRGLEVHKEVMGKHIEDAGESYKTQAYMIQLTDKGMTREEAYKRLQEDDKEGLELEEVTLEELVKNRDAIFKRLGWL